MLLPWNIYSQSIVDKQDSTAISSPRINPDSLSQEPAQKQYLNAPVIYPARDSTIMSFEDNKIKMYGEAKVEYEDFSLQADYVEISIDKKEVFACGVPDSTGKLVGTPKFKQGEEEFECKELRYNFDSQKARVMDVVMKQDVGGDQGTLHSGITKRFPDGTVNLRHGKFSTCDADDPHFYFAITKGKMVHEKSIVSGPAYLVIEGIPLYFVGLPFGYFPQKRTQTSGLIMPQYGKEVNRGYYLRNGGWYFAINDNLDLKLTGDIYSKGSWKGGAESSYAKRYKYRGALGLSLAKNVTGERDLADFGKYQATSDFSIRWSHSQDAKAHPYRTFNANVNLSSSSFDKYNSDITNTAARLTNTKSSSIAYSRKFANPLFNFTAKLGHTQNSRDSSLVLTLPDVSFTVGRFYPFKRKVRVGKQRWYEKIDMRYTSTLQNKVYGYERQFFDPNSSDDIPFSFSDSIPTILSNMKNGFKHEVPMTATFKLFKDMNVTPSLNYEGLLFFTALNKEWDPEEKAIVESQIFQPRYVQALSPNFNMTYNPQIFGFFDFKRGPVKTIRHSLKPSLSFSYRPDLGYDDTKYDMTVQKDTTGALQTYSIFDDQLYRLPNVAGQYGNITLALTNNLEMKMIDKADTTGQKLKKVKLIENFGLNTSYDIFRDSMNLSDLRFTARTRVLNNVNIQFSSVFDPYSWYLDPESGSARKIGQYLITENGLPARLSNASLSIGFSLPMTLGSKTGNSSRGNFYAEDGYSYGFPWDMRLDYSLRYVKNNPYVDGQVTQTLRFSGKFRFSEKWQFNYSSGYDFVLKELTYTTLSVTRDLHCWKMAFTIIPFGTSKSYSFTLNVNSNLFKDVKYRKEKSWFDNDDFF